MKSMLRCAAFLLGLLILASPAAYLAAQPVSGKGNDPGTAKPTTTLQQKGLLDNPNARNEIRISLRAEKTSLQPGDELRFTAETDRDCFLTLLYVSESGDVVVLWPNQESGWDNRVRAHRLVRIPEEGSNIRLKVDGRQPYERILAVACSKPDGLLSKRDYVERPGRPVKNLAFRADDLREELRRRVDRLPESVEWGTSHVTVRVATAAMDTESYIESLSPKRGTLEAIRDLNEAIRQKGFEWEAGVTSLSELSQEEQLARCGAGDDPEQLMGRGAEPFDEEDMIILEGGEESRPSQWDWRNVKGKDWTTPIRDQGSCGSCAAFASTGVVEIAYQIYRKKVNSGIDLSEGQVFFCGCGKCCTKGWYLEKAFSFTKKTGIFDEKAFPYDPKEQGCSASQVRDAPEAGKVRTTVAAWVKITDPQHVKNWVFRKGPVAVRMDVYEDFFKYKKGIYKVTSKVKKAGHFVVIVGYDDKKKYWICKNSWGSGWGENGWFKIGYGQSGMGAFPFMSVKTPIKRIKQ